MNEKACQSTYSLIRKAASAAPEAAAYDFLGFKRTYGDFLSDIDRCAETLNAAGVKKGDAVTIYLPNIPRALVLFYAAGKIGAVVNFIHPRMPVSNHESILKKIRPKFIFILDSMKELGAPLKRAVPSAGIMVVAANEFMPAPLKQLYCFKSLAYRFRNNRNVEYYKESGTGEIIPEAETDPGDTAVILLTGGTTGVSRGVCLSSVNVNTSALQTASYRLPNDGRDRMLAILPVFHGYGLINCIHTAFAEGAELVLLPYYKEKLFKKTILRTKPEYILGIPRLYSRMADIFMDMEVSLDFFRGLYCGGAKLSSPVLEKINRVLSDKGSAALVQEGYGLTECVGACTLMPPDVTKDGSIGLPYEGVRISIRDSACGSLLPPGTAGEICVCSDTVMNGYLDGDSPNLRMYDGERWLHTGDMGHMDSEGYVFFTGRQKRMIKISGYEVYPDVVESIINDIPGVANSCVVETQRNGLSYIKAYIVSAAAHKDRLLKDISTVLHKRLPGWSVPGEFEFIGSIPETLLKKNDYRALT